MKNGLLILLASLLFILFISTNSLFAQGNIVSANSDPQSKTKDIRGGMKFPEFKEPGAGLVRIINSLDTLQISIEFTECGEWGGHMETIYLQRNSKNEIVARFIKDSVSCDNITLIDYVETTVDSLSYSIIDPKSRIIVLDTIKTLTSKDEKLFNLFLHRVFELYLNHSLYYSQDSILTLTSFADAGSSIRIKNSDASLNLYYWNEDENSNTWYGYIRKEVFGLGLQRK